MKKNFPELFFLLFVLLVSFAFFGLIQGFLMAVFWAIIFAILFSKNFDRWNERLKGRRNLAAALTLGNILLIVILPLSIVGVIVIDEATDYYQAINQENFNVQEELSKLRARTSTNEKWLADYGLNVDKIEAKIQDFITTGFQFIADRAVNITQDVFGFLINFSLMLYILFFFLRDGKRLVEELVWVLPIGDKQEWELLGKFESVARATVKGSLLVALVQGAIGGVLFWIVGIPAAFIWGVIMVLLSLLPIGSAVVWLPAAVILIIQGSIGKGIAVIIVGAFLIGLVDNLLRPRLVGQDTKMPDYLILLSTLGGLAWFGLSGFVIGPIIAALFVTCWQMLGSEYGRPHDEVVHPVKQFDKEVEIEEKEIPTDLKEF
ncbi:MAG: AI-2E family transporter [Bacteroidota bacterium]